ncbi:Nuclear GTPase SLIP-GC [Pseudocercospora fuligena]|uniref:Nuclear GTPase SLIP-GC n=1 Tax=Pseudocercospora fuligena TaxID=685502 RepID=A0A8H6RN57_9PEZI|nr:Nuclear GTPase SLIP-GC [Pseudocercospora fuligena]
MSSFSFGVSRKRGRDDDVALGTPGAGLFVTGLTPTPAPETPSRDLSRARSQIPGSFTDQTSHIDDEEREMDDDADGEGETEEEEEEEDIYSQDTEAFPKHIAYDNGLPLIQQRAEKLASKLQAHLEPFQQTSEDVHVIHSRAVAAQAAPEVTKPEIALHGQTGTGKSSTTNAFVDDLEASKAASNGDSCTTAATLIKDSIPGQQLPYAAEIWFYDGSTCRHFLSEQVGHYIKFTFEKDPQWSVEEQHLYSSRSATALKVFQSLFCDQDGFDSPGAIERYFRQRRHTALPTLELWCSELLSAFEEREGQHVLRFEAETAEQLNEAINPHIFEKNDPEEPMLWPLVEHVCKGFSNSRILKFVDVLDLPGTSDTNTVRAEISHKFIAKATALLTVCPIGRVIADADLDLTLATYGRRFGSNIAVIATRSDADLKPEVARDLEKDGQSVSDYWALGDRVRELKEELKAHRKPRNAPKRRRTSMDADAKKHALQAEIDEAMDEQFDCLVEARNAYVSRRLKQAKQKHLSAGASLAVFPVSNTHYGVHKGNDASDKRLMHVETTNIPALRSHALLLAAPQQFHAIEIRINEAILALRGAILWTESPPTKRNESLMSIVAQPGQLLRSILEECRRSSEQYATAQLITPLNNGRSSFVLASLAYARHIQSTWHHASVRAFFAKNGKHKTAAQYEVWNERFTDGQKKTLEPGLSSMLPQLFSMIQAAITKLKASIRDIPDQLGNSPNAVPIAIEPLKENLEGFITQIQLKVDEHKQELDTKLKNVALHATQDVPSAYFTQAMVPMYNEAQTYQGKGCTARMHTLLSDYLQGLSPAPSSPFTSVSTGLKQDFEDVTDWLTRTLERDIQEILSNMTKMFEGILTRQVESPGEKQARMALKPFLSEAKIEMDEIVKELIALKIKYGEELSDEEKVFQALHSEGRARRRMEWFGLFSR